MRSAKNNSLLTFIGSRNVLAAIAVQLASSSFLAHGYDFRVEYVAGRNIVNGISPYLGGSVSGWLTLGYGTQVQGIGETPIWALYLGLCYFLGSGQPFIFNFLSKIPIVAANVGLAYFAYSRGLTGWRFFLFNFYLIATSVTWGKPDNLATILAILALVATESATNSALLLSTSCMIKPLAVAILPAFFLRMRTESSRWNIKFILGSITISAILFLGPFVIFGWPIETVTGGFAAWFRHAGALSPLNIIKVGYGTEELPAGLWWLGYLAPLGILLLTAYAIVRAPQNRLSYALLSSTVFFTLRPWNSEQNLVIILALFLLLKGELSMWLWTIPTIFAIANNSLQVQLYLVWPTIVDELNGLYAPFDNYRLWLRFILSLAWLVVLWFNAAPLIRDAHKTRVDSAGTKTC